MSHGKGNMNGKTELRLAHTRKCQFPCGATVLATVRVGISIALLFSAQSAFAADEVRPRVEPATDSTSTVHGSVFVDPLGFALFGPRLGVEWGTDHLTGSIYGRWLNGGLLSHSIFLGSGDNFDFSYGVALRGRYYLAEGLRALHLGLAVEYLRTRVETPSVLTVTKSAYVVPQFEVGYRIPVGGFYIDGSGAVGYAARASGSVENQPGGSNAAQYSAANESTIYGALSLELGVYF
jgi:hypothetical protein